MSSPYFIGLLGLNSFQKRDILLPEPVDVIWFS